MKDPSRSQGTRGQLTKINLTDLRDDFSFNFLKLMKTSLRLTKGNQADERIQQCNKKSQLLNVYIELISYSYKNEC